QPRRAHARKYDGRHRHARFRRQTGGSATSVAAPIPWSPASPCAPPPRSDPAKRCEPLCRSPTASARDRLEAAIRGGTATMVSSNRKARVPDELGRARASYGRRAWAEAYQAFCRADRKGRLAAEDLERLAVVAFLTGRDDAYLTTLERAYDSYLAGGEHLRAVRCAFWLGFRLLMRGEMGRASGWFGRGERLLAQAAPDCAGR